MRGIGLLTAGPRSLYKLRKHLRQPGKPAACNLGLLSFNFGLPVSLWGHLAFQGRDLELQGLGPMQSRAVRRFSRTKLVGLVGRDTKKGADAKLR